MMLRYDEEEISLNWQFQPDNDPKHCLQLMKKWLLDELADTLP